MSSWDTNQCSIFCDLYWDLICRKKWHQETSKISTPPEIVVGARFHAQHNTKITPVFLPVDGEASWLLLVSLVSLLSSGIVQPENTYSCVLKVTGQVRSERANKGSASILPHSYHQRSFNWSNNKIRFILNQPKRNGCKAGQCNKSCTP